MAHEAAEKDIEKKAKITKLKEMTIQKEGELEIK